MSIKTGDRLVFRDWQSDDTPVHVTVGTCQDAGYLGIMLQQDRYVHFDNQTGKVDGYRDEPTATGEERVYFLTDNIMMSASGSLEDGPRRPFEVFRVL